MNLDQSIQQHNIPAHTLLWNFVWRSSAWGLGAGVALGYVYGFVVIALWSLFEVTDPTHQLNLFDSIRAVFMLGIYAAMIGATIGALLGLLLGLASGLIIGIMTRILFSAPPNFQRYLKFVRFISVSVSISGSIAALHLTVMRLTDYALIYMIIPAIIAGVGAWWVSGQMVKWYARATTG